MDTITTPTPKQSPPANSLILPATAWFGGQRGVAQPVPLTQYDDTLPVLAVALYLNGQPYTVPDGAAVNVRMDKRDGHYIYNPAYGLSDDRKTVYVAVTLQMTTSAGEFPAILELVVGGDVAGTSILPLAIRKNPVPEDAVESTDEYKTIQKIAEEVEQAAQVVVDNAETLQWLKENEQVVVDVSENADNINAVAGNIPDINTVAGNAANINAAVAEMDAIKAAPDAAARAAVSAANAAQHAQDADASAQEAERWAEQAQQIAQGAMGWYADPQALQSAHPTGQNGQFAIVGSTDTIWIWDSDTSAWVDSSIDAYTKEEADDKFATIQQVQEAVDQGYHLYKTIFYASGWGSSAPYVQRQGLTKMDGGPDVTASSIIGSVPMSRQTTDESTNKAFQRGLACINAGWMVLGANTIEAHVFDKPTSDVEVYLLIRKG